MECLRLRKDSILHFYLNLLSAVDKNSLKLYLSNASAMLFHWLGESSFYNVTFFAAVLKHKKYKLHYKLK